MEKFILNCAVTGAIHTPTMAPYLPIKPRDIARQAIDAVNAGASTVHVHARDPENGMPTGNLDIMGEIVSTIHSRCDAVICITTGGGMNMTVDERIASVPEFKPELVEKMVRIAGELGYEPATPDETRKMLKLKGRDKVNM